MRKKCTKMRNKVIISNSRILTREKNAHPDERIADQNYIKEQFFKRDVISDQRTQSYKLKHN